VCHYLRDPTFSYFGTIPKCDRQRQTNDDGIYNASIASHGKKQKVEQGKKVDCLVVLNSFLIIRKYV